MAAKPATRWRLLNATLGNLTELVIALTALRAGQYMLVKASIAGAIVTNTLFMLGASFLLGGLKQHTQEYNRVNARFQAGLLFLATIALLIPSALSQADSAPVAAFTQQLRWDCRPADGRLRTGLLFSLKTIASCCQRGSRRSEGPRGDGLALARAASGAGGARERTLSSGAEGALDLGFAGLRGVLFVGGRRGGRDGLGVLWGAQESLDLSVHCVGARRRSLLIAPVLVLGAISSAKAAGICNSGRARWHGVDLHMTASSSLTAGARGSSWSSRFCVCDFA